MYGTKVEVTLPKAEPGHWATLDIKKKPPKPAVNSKEISVPESKSDDGDSDVDLDDIEPLRGCKITDAWNLNFSNNDKILDSNKFPFVNRKKTS